MKDPRSIDGEGPGEFDLVVSPLVASLSALITSTNEDRERFRWMPTADSPAMRELAEEHRFAGAWRAHPLNEAHHHAGLLLLAAEDHAAAMCRLIADPAPTIFAHIPMARAALEACAWSRWMSDGDVGPEVRVGRYMTEWSYSDTELARSAASDGERFKSRRAEIEAQAAQVGIDKYVSRRHPPAFGSLRPGSTRVMKLLFTRPQSGMSDDVNLGQLVFSLYSAVAHGTVYGLRRSLRHLNEGQGPTAASDSWTTHHDEVAGGLIVDADDVGLTLGVVTDGYILSAISYRALMGWPGDTWRKEAMNAHDLAKRAVDEAERRRGERAQTASADE